MQKLIDVNFDNWNLQISSYIHNSHVRKITQLVQALYIPQVCDDTVKPDQTAGIYDN